jgi:hypothetical protein
VVRLTAPRTGLLYPQEYPGTHFERLSRPRAHGLVGCLGKKSAVTRPGIDPGTFRLVAQRNLTRKLNNCKPLNLHQAGCSKNKGLVYLLDNPEMRGGSLRAKHTIFNFRFIERQTAWHEAISQLYGQSSLFQPLGLKNQVNSRGETGKACRQPLPHDRRGSQARFMSFQTIKL